MKIWKVSTRGEDDEHRGYSYFRTKHEAEQDPDAHSGEYSEIEIIVVEVSAAGILAALNLHASHPDNG